MKVGDKFQMSGTIREMNDEKMLVDFVKGEDYAHSWTTVAPSSTYVTFEVFRPKRTLAIGDKVRVCDFDCEVIKIYERGGRALVGFTDGTAGVFHFHEIQWRD